MSSPPPSFALSFPAPARTKSSPERPVMASLPAPRKSVREVSDAAENAPNTPCRFVVNARGSKKAACSIGGAAGLTVKPTP